jgi:mitochondrial fission protein ELM1
MAACLGLATPTGLRQSAAMNLGDIAAWVVSDGTVGMEIQSLGLAGALGIEPRILRLRPRPPWRWLPPKFWWRPFLAVPTGGDRPQPPWPDLVIGTGRNAAGFTRAIRRASGGRTFAVQIQDPRMAPTCFDLIVVPEHDDVGYANAVSTLGSLHGVTPARLAEARQRFAPLLAHLPRPLVAVLIGGSNRRYRLTPESAVRLGRELAALGRSGYGLAVSPSRRTGNDNEAAIKDQLADVAAYVWDCAGDNPYLGLLAHADAILVTADSVNMTIEALATGKPVHVVDLPGDPGKFVRFHATLQARGLTRRFVGRIESWSYAPPDDTPRVAAVLRERLTAHLARIRDRSSDHRAAD